MKPRQARRRNGRFVRNTPENTLGIHIDICPRCRRLNTWDRGSPAPTNCHACGAPLNEDRDEETKDARATRK